MAGRNDAGGLRASQRDMLSEMLHKGSDLDKEWRVLVFDQMGLDILSPLIKVKELRDLGITLHLLIDAPRQPIAGVPAIYFCDPTPENVTRIGADVKNELYQRFDINFLSQASREVLEQLATELVAVPSINHVRVFDRTMNFVSLAADLFTLTTKRTFTAIHSKHASEAVIDPLFARISRSLTHVFMATDSLPVVGYVRSGPASELAQSVTRQLADVVRERLVTAPSTSSRPLLLIVDRSYDLTAPLHHPFTYRGLVCDALGMRLNKVDVTVDGAKKCFEMDPDTDGFWNDNAAKPFDQVSQNIEEALSSYKREYQALTASEGMSPSDASSADAVTKMLALAPVLAERKRSLDAHTSIAFAALNCIRSRHLDAFHGVEESLLKREELDKVQFSKLLDASDRKVLDSDRLRLFLLAKMLSEDDQATFVDEHTHALRPDGATARIPALEFVKKTQAWSVQGASPASQQEGSGGWGFAQTLTKNFTKAFSSSEAASELPLTRLVDMVLSQPRPGSTAARDRAKALEALAAVDPRAPGASIDVASAKFSNVVVFVLGGGSVTEYDNLKRCERTAGVVYGCTEMLSGEEFLEQLSALGDER